MLFRFERDVCEHVLEQIDRSGNEVSDYSLYLNERPSLFKRPSRIPLPYDTMGDDSVVGRFVVCALEV